MDIRKTDRKPLKRPKLDLSQSIFDNYSRSEKIIQNLYWRDKAIVKGCVCRTAMGLNSVLKAEDFIEEKNCLQG